MMSNDNMKQAYHLYRLGEQNQALHLFEQILQNEPKNLDVLHITSIIYAQKNQYDKALSTIAKAIKIDPKQAMFFNTRGNIYLRQNNLSKAIESFQQAIQLKQNYASAYNNLGNCYYRQERLNQAKETYLKALTIKPQYADAAYNLGILHSKLGEFDDAIERLKEAIDLKEEHPAALGQLGQIYLLRHQYPKAIYCLRHRLESDPDNVETLHSLGNAYLQQHDYEKAVHYFEKVLMLDPKHLECNHNLANAHLQMNDPDKALNYYFRQLENKPEMESYYNIGVILLQKQRQREASEYLQQALKLDPGFLPAHINLAGLYLKANDIPNAIKHYEIATIIKPDDEEIRHVLTALKQDQTPEKAPKEYLQRLFDQYATYYDKHLTEVLDYHVPDKLLHAIELERELEPASLTILDLGCGTGLVGEHFQRYAKNLIGIDISSEMITKAKKKKIYHTLKVYDIKEALDHYKHNDIIVAADVFTYIGNLDDIFAKAKSALNDNGLFIFSVEKTSTEPYILQQTIRYAHSRHYLMQLITKHQYKILKFDNLMLRKHQGKPVEGYLVLLSKE